MAADLPASSARRDGGEGWNTGYSRRRGKGFVVTDHAYEDLVQSGPLLAESDAAFAAYDSATIKRVVLYLRAVAAETDQVHPGDRHPFGTSRTYDRYAFAS